MKIIRIGAIWCPGCLSMRKIWKKIEEEYKDIEMIEYDYDMDRDEIEGYDVGKILPVTIFIDKDKEVDRLIGEITVKEIEDVVGKYV